MQIGLRLHDAEKTSLDKMLINVKNQGFSCVHLALSKIDGLPADIDALSPGYATWLRHRFEEAGLDIAVLGNYLNLAHPDKQKLKEIQKRYYAHLRFASLLGCSVVGTETCLSFSKEVFHIVAVRLFVCKAVLKIIHSEI